MSLTLLWWIAAFVLIAAEMLLPGFFLLWIGLAAAGVGALLLLSPALSLPLQIAVFAVLSVIACVACWRFSRRGVDSASRSPTLNRRAEQLIGQCYVLDSAIQNGRGKARVGDSLWLVEGPDLPAGAQVSVVSVDGATLYVQPAEPN